MTISASGGAVTVMPGDPATLLTEYAPASGLYVIHRGVAGTVWLGSDSFVGPANGTPLEPFTAVPWTTPGQLWIVPDDAAAAPIPLTITPNIGDYTPPPAAIAAATAAQLLATGVPSVLIEDVIADAVPILGGESDAFDVSGYASAVVTAYSVSTDPDSPVPPNTVALRLDQGADADRIVSSLRQLHARVAVVGAQLVVLNELDSVTHVTITGSNRAAAERFDVRANTALGDSWANVAPAVVGPSNQVTLSQADPTTQLVGKVWATFRVDKNIDGAFRLNLANGRVVTLCETSQMSASDDGATMFRAVEVALPASDYVLSFITYGGSAAGPSSSVTWAVRFLPA